MLTATGLDNRPVLAQTPGGPEQSASEHARQLQRGLPATTSGCTGGGAVAGGGRRAQGQRSGLVHVVQPRELVIIGNSIGGRRDLERYQVVQPRELVMRS